jgi:hypothetical protein
MNTLEHCESTLWMLHINFCQCNEDILYVSSLTKCNNWRNTPAIHLNLYRTVFKFVWVIIDKNIWKTHIDMSTFQYMYRHVHVAIFLQYSWIPDPCLHFLCTAMQVFLSLGGYYKLNWLPRIVQYLMGGCNWYCTNSNQQWTRTSVT